MSSSEEPRPARQTLHCPKCNSAITVQRLVCPGCGVLLPGDTKRAEQPQQDGLGCFGIAAIVVCVLAAVIFVVCQQIHFP